MAGHRGEWLHTSSYQAGATAGDAVSTAADRRPERLTTETKSSIKTTEIVFYVLAVIGVLIASSSISADDGATDWFRADKAWSYVVLLTIGYMISRGLAKSGSRERYDR